MKTKRYSDHAQHIVDFAQKLGVRIWSDPDWSRVEAGEIETPQGVVHLHWMNHRGRGHWNIVSRANEICKTVRCRVVTIIPHGGENESVAIDKQKFYNTMETWANNKSLDYDIAFDIAHTPQRR